MESYDWKLSRIWLKLSQSWSEATMKSHFLLLKSRNLDNYNQFRSHKEEISCLKQMLMCCVGCQWCFWHFYREDMRNSFNFLLVALISMDSCFLFFSIIESFRRGFKILTWLHVMLFPHLIFPMQSISVTSSIYMTVGIAFERYIAVHYPIDYSQVTQFEPF